MKSLLLVVAVVLVPAAAQADVVSLRAEIHGGGGFGKGISGDPKDDAFFADAPHGVYGALVGVEFFFIDMWIQHHQYVNGDRIATWTQFSTGFDVQVPFGDEGQPDVSGKRPGAQNYAEVGFGLGFGLGTGQQVDPPLSNDEITDKGIIGEAQLSIGHKLGKLADVGVRIPVGYGYFLKSGVANDLSNHYQGFQAQAMLYLRLKIDIK